VHGNHRHAKATSSRNSEVSKPSQFNRKIVNRHHRKPHLVWMYLSHVLLHHMAWFGLVYGFYFTKPRHRKNTNYTYVT